MSHFSTPGPVIGFFSTLCLVSAITVFAYLPGALACVSDGPLRAEINEEDTPECVELSLFYGSTIYAQNHCDEEVELQAIDCDGQCDTNIVIAPGEDAEILLEARGEEAFEDGEFVRQSYRWELGEQSGQVATTVRYREREYSGGCAEDSYYGCANSGGGAPPASVILIVMALAALALRRDMLANRS